MLVYWNMCNNVLLEKAEHLVEEVKQSQLVEPASPGRKEVEQNFQEIKSRLCGDRVMVSAGF